MNDKITLNEIENLMQRWHLGRDEDIETIEAINELMVKSGRLQFENGKCTSVYAGAKKTVCPKCGCTHVTTTIYCNKCNESY